VCCIYLKTGVVDILSIVVDCILPGIVRRISSSPSRWYGDEIEVQNVRRISSYMAMGSALIHQKNKAILKAVLQKFSRIFAQKMRSRGDT